ncbi:MAG: DUF2235 domain-containing protein [Candidatus Brocadiales bacterium]|nr:DUF2235 domain-containing protein [Candidatus Brocadiales bacterium]
MDTNQKSGKNIVICCDGTGNEYGKYNTNVVKLFGMIEKGPKKQIAFYDPGVGTSGAPGAWSKAAKVYTKIIGLAFSYGITKNIEDAYEYLMDKYEKGDTIYLFGFSRGAYTVRALAGMLHKCGLLQKGSNNLIPYASRMYRKGEPELAKGFKQTFSRDCIPHFIGVWDTVKSVGLFIPRKFPDTLLNPDIKNGFHALSIDEKRSKFRPNLWDKPKDTDQTIEQVWFAGVHSDVGGGYEKDVLSNITLLWMLDKARLYGLHIDDAKYKILTDKVDKPDERKNKLHNSLLPIYWIFGWWKRSIIDKKKYEIPFIHESVYKRINDKVDGYNPKNLPPKNQVNVVNRN